MFNLEENLELNNDYNNQRDLILKIFYYSTSVVSLFELIRGQVPEVNLLQLIPGFYLFLLFIFFLFCLFFFRFFLFFPTIIEIKKNPGAKTLGRMSYSLTFQFSIFFFLFIVILNLNTVIPISLESFNTYGEKTLENLWSFNEVINLEIFLLILLTIISQIPTFSNFYLITEENNAFLPRFWKGITLMIVIISGFLTPTIDGYTQLSFSFSSFSLYILLLLFLKKRVNFKSNGITFFGL